MPGFRIGIEQGGWRRALERMRRLEQTVQARERRAVMKAALYAEREMKKGLASGVPGGIPRAPLAPLAPITILLRRKRSNRPLLDSGSLLGAITTRFDGRTMSAFVGILRASRNSRGRPLTDIATVHEFGTKPFVIPVTPGLRRLFMMLHIRSRGRIMPISSNKTVIHHPGVPARPFVRPVYESIREKVREIIAKEMEGLF